MRVAPVAMLIASEISRGQTSWTENDVIRLASECAKITHKHPMGYICAAVFADILFQIFNSESDITEELLLKIVETALASSHAYYKEEREIEECGNLRWQINNVIRLSESSMPDHEAISQLGEGWTGDETLTIACSALCARSMIFMQHWWLRLIMMGTAIQQAQYVVI